LGRESPRAAFGPRWAGVPEQVASAPNCPWLGSKRLSSGKTVICYLGDDLGDFPYDFNASGISPSMRKRLALEAGNQLTARHPASDVYSPLADAWSRAPSESWGAGWFVVPNPTYGKWERLTNWEEPGFGLRMWKSP